MEKRTPITNDELTNFFTNNAENEVVEKWQSRATFKLTQALDEGSEVTIYPIDLKALQDALKGRTTNLKNNNGDVVKDHSIKVCAEYSMGLDAFAYPTNIRWKEKADACPNVFVFKGNEYDSMVDKIKAWNALFGDKKQMKLYLYRRGTYSVISRRDKDEYTIPVRIWSTKKLS